MTSYIPCAAHFHFHFPSSIFHLPSTRISLSLPGYLIFHLFRLHLPHYFNTLMHHSFQQLFHSVPSQFTVYTQYLYTVLYAHTNKLPLLHSLLVCVVVSSRFAVGACADGGGGDRERAVSQAEAAVAVVAVGRGTLLCGAAGVAGDAGE